MNKINLPSARDMFIVLSLYREYGLGDEELAVSQKSADSDMEASIIIQRVPPPPRERDLNREKHRYFPSTFNSNGTWGGFDVQIPDSFPKSLVLPTVNELWLALGQVLHKSDNPEVWCLFKKDDEWHILLASKNLNPSRTPSPARWIGLSQTDFLSISVFTKSLSVRSELKPWLKQ